MRTKSRDRAVLRTVVLGLVAALGILPVALVSAPVNAQPSPGPTITTTPPWPPLIPPSTCLSLGAGATAVAPTTLDSGDASYASALDGCAYYVRDVRFLRPSQTDDPAERGLFTVFLLPWPAFGIQEMTESKAKCESTVVEIYVYKDDVRVADAVVRGEWNPNASGNKCERSDGEPFMFPLPVTARIDLPATGPRQYRVLSRRRFTGSWIDVEMYVSEQQSN